MPLSLKYVEPSRKAAADLSPAEIEETGRRAGAEAARRTFAAGRPVTTIEDGWIVDKWVDGRSDRLEPLDEA